MICLQACHSLLTLLVVSLAAAALPGASCLAKSKAQQSAANREWFIGVAGVEQKLHQEIGRQILALVKTASAGDVIHVCGLPSLTPIASLTIPDGSPALRLRNRELNGPYMELQRYFFSKDYEPGSTQIALPDIPSYIASVRKTEFPAAVVLCGDPCYSGEPLHGAFDSRHGRVPTDASLVASPYQHLSPLRDGIKDFCKNASVNILAHNPQWGVDTVHRSAWERAVRIILQEHGDAKLLRITADVESAFNMEPPNVPVARVVPKQDEFGMRLCTIGSAQSNTADTSLVVYLGWPKNKPPIFAVDPPEGVESVSKRALKSKTHTAVAMRYLPDSSNLTLTDLDWVIHHPNFKEPLHYKNPKTPFGKLHKDVRYGEGGMLGDKPVFGKNWEIVVVPNDELPKLEAWVNVYYAVGPIRVHVCTVGNGEIRETYFTIDSQYGDEAADSAKRQTSRAWCRVALPLSGDKTDKSPWLAASRAAGKTR